MNQLSTLSIISNPKNILQFITENPRCLSSVTVYILSKIYLPSHTDLDIGMIKVSHGELRERVLMSIMESTDDVSLLYILLSALDQYILSEYNIRLPDMTPLLNFKLNGFMKELIHIDRYLHARCRIIYARRNNDYTNMPRVDDVANDITQVPVIATQFLTAKPKLPVISLNPFRVNYKRVWQLIRKTWISIEDDAEYALEFCKRYLECMRSNKAMDHLYDCMSDIESSTIYSGFYSLCYSLMTPDEQGLSKYTPLQSDKYNKIDSYILSDSIKREDIVANEDDPLITDIYNIIEYYSSNYIEYHFHANEELSIKQFALEIEHLITDDHFSVKSLETNSYIKNYLPLDNFISKLRSQGRKTNDNCESLSSNILYILMHAALLGAQIPDCVIEQIVQKVKL